MGTCTDLLWSSFLLTFALLKATSFKNLNRIGFSLRFSPNRQVDGQNKRDENMGKNF